MLKNSAMLGRAIPQLPDEQMAFSGGIHPFHVPPNQAGDLAFHGRRYDTFTIWNPWQADLGDWIRKTGVLP